MISEKDRVKYYLNDIKNKKDTKLINPLNVNTIIKSKKIVTLMKNIGDL